MDRAEVQRSSRRVGRHHLGASVIGGACLRATWYGWRWAYIENHTGRMYRLFRRGHLEEVQVVEGLRVAGAAVDEVDPATGKQFTFSDHDGHFGGSHDGRLVWEHAFGDSRPRLLECKTHNLKSFAQLSTKRVQQAKPAHFHQMQIYMHYFGFHAGLYVAVCKDNDERYYEVIPYKPELAKLLVDRARDLIDAHAPPARINSDPSWFICKMCSYREICHYDEAPAKNCRSCSYAYPVENGAWHCKRFDGILPQYFMPYGCDHWDAIT